MYRGFRVQAAAPESACKVLVTETAAYSTQRKTNVVSEFRFD